jgi:hypothetical protein
LFGLEFSEKFLAYSYDSHFPLAPDTRARKRAQASLATTTSFSAAAATDNASKGPVSPLASFTSIATGAGSDSLASCDSHLAATMYDLSLFAGLVATFVCMFLF